MLAQPNASLENAFQTLADRIGATQRDVGLLSIAIGALVEVLTALLEVFEAKAPLSTLQIRAALELPIGSPPDSGTRLTIVPGGKKTA